MRYSEWVNRWTKAHNFTCFLHSNLFCFKYFVWILTIGIPCAVVRAANRINSYRSSSSAAFFTDCPRSFIRAGNNLLLINDFKNDEFVAYLFSWHLSVQTNIDAFHLDSPPKSTIDWLLRICPLGLSVWEVAAVVVVAMPAIGAAAAVVPVTALLMPLEDFTSCNGGKFLRSCTGTDEEEGIGRAAKIGRC